MEKMVKVVELMVAPLDGPGAIESEGRKKWGVCYLDV